MIPQLSVAPDCDKRLEQFVTAVKARGFCGDIAIDYATRLTMATDNSIYQQLPQAVCFPRSTADIVVLMQVASEPEFHEFTLVPRGGGTGTNGQSLNRGIVIDLSRYMNRILEVNIEEGWVRVEAGVIKDQLNQVLKPHGYFFSPELSTSNRATIGGMINTDASGQGSLVYGKTSDHVLGLRSVLCNGELLDTLPMPIALAEQLAESHSATGQIYRTVLNTCQQHRALILASFPKLTRFLTGYDLRHVISDDETTFDLSRLLTGSEGTLAIITEAKIHITPLPKVRYLVNIKYDSFDSALRNANFLLEASALSVETVDSNVLNLAKEDIVWSSVSDLLTDVPNQTMLGINIVEFAGDDANDISQKIQKLTKRLDDCVPSAKNGIIGYQICDKLDEIERIYAMRKKAVGLLGNAKGAAKPIPFVEDTAVPPAHLADYIAEFRALLDRHQLSYGMFGHVDAGVLHVRPALDLCDAAQVAKIREITNQVVALTQKYGGLIWGEHGKGLRSEFCPDYFGPTLYQELRRVKGVFDPNNRLNPGKICTPLGNEKAEISTIESPLRADFDRQIPVTVRQEFAGAINCNGNGLCFNFDVHSAMCPSMKISQDRIHSPKGRAGLVREWLRLLTAQGVTPQTLEKWLTTSSFSLRHLLTKTKNSWRAKQGDYDFSHEVYQSMKGCLSCKACSTQCPIKIDVPAFRSQFLHLYHSRYMRPMQDHVVANVESYTPLMAMAPRFFNFFMRQPLVNTLSQKTVGMVDLPLLSVPTLKQQLKSHPTANLSFEALAALPDSERAHYVLIIQDAFTGFYDAKVVHDFVMLLDKMKFKPVVVPFMANGKPKHVKGFLPEFKKVAAKTAEKLNRFASLKLPMVAVDPAMALVYRDEYHILGEQRGDFHIQLAHEWLLAHAANLPQLPTPSAKTWYLFGHCTETTALPDSSKQWQAIFAQMGETLEPVNVGCCGMAGTYGHEAKHRASSKALFGLSWQPKLADKPMVQCLATGYSCRSQVNRLTQQTMMHPVQALLQLMSSML